MNYSAPIYKGKNSLIYYQEETEYGQPVVIKVFPEPIPTIQQLSFFKNEYEIIKDIDIKGIRKALGQTKIDGRAGLVLEYVKGEAISNVLAAKTLDLKTFLKIAISISQTLGEVHQHQIIHLDINNNNMLVDLESLNTTIIDFGISSRINTKTPHLGNPDTLEGTLAYISPEQTGRMNRLVDHRTDLYSLGVSFYEMLTGQLPFSGNNSLELVHAHIARQALPPHEVNPEIPAILSAIVMRLLAKNAEDRYQSAYGLKYDLEQCLQQLTDAAPDFEPNFELGKQDFSGKFHLIEKLYGREEEVKVMLDTVNRVAEGASELLLVTGYSGIGKSALVNEVHKPMTEKQAHFIKGKYDQFQRDVPYSAINQAFNEFCAHLLTLSESSLAVWRQVLQDTLGNNGKILTEVIPNLEFILGKQPEVLEVGAQEAQNRFNLLMQNFVKAISTQEHPLILFLDDLQWADLASLNLLKLLLTDESNQYFLAIGAYRDNEVDSAHPFMLMLDEVKKALLPITEIQLQNLPKSSVNELITDTLRSPNPERVKGLTELIYQKTLGNAFFTTQLLRSIYEDGMLAFNFEQRQWEWELERIRAHQIADNVVALMTQKIVKLPASSQAVLKAAACIGNQFDLNLLAATQENTPHETFAALWEAITAGFIAPLDDHYKAFQQKMVVDTQIDANPRFRFVHDRIHQASFSLLNQEEQAQSNLAIGRLICQNHDQTYIDERICDVANYYNAGNGLVSDAEELLWIAKVNLQAGKKAQTSTAYQSAVRYYEAAIAILGKQQGWEQSYNLMFELYKCKGECEFLLGVFDQAKATLDLALSKAQNKLDKVAIYAIQLAQLSLQAQYAQACELAVEALNHFGMEAPPLHDKEAYGQLTVKEFELYGQHMSQHAIEDLAQLPLMENEDAQIYSQIICWVLDSMILSHAHVLGYYTVKVVNMSLEYGLNEYVPNAFVFNALIQCSQKNYEVAYEFASLSVKLNEDRFNTGGLKCKIRHINSFTRNLREPMTNTHFLDTFKIGLETGDNVYASFACGVAVRYSFPKGIQEVYAAANIAIPFLKKINNAAILIHVELVVGMAKCLEGKTKHALSFDDVDDPQGIRQRNEDVFGEGRSPMMWSFIASYELQLFVLFEAYAKGLPYIHDRVKIVDESGTGATDLQFRSEYFFYSGVILANLYADASPEEQIEYMQILEECLEELRLLANSCKHNFHHLLQGLAAEKARIMGDAMAAMDLYDEAINYAQQGEFMKDEALLSELAGRFWLGKNKDNFAEMYLRRAYQLYKNWGATAKVKDLDTKYPSYVYQGYQKSSAKATTSMPQGKSTVGLNSGSGGSVLDLDSILRASQALSQEVKIDALLAKMLHIVIENTGAQSGYLIDHVEGNLWIRAQGDVNVAETITPATPIDTGDYLPVSLVHLATRGKQTLVIDNASEHPQYAQDQYIVQHQTKSALCYPVLRQGEVSLLFYLENNLVAGAFTPERLEVLNTLSSQMAISVENALLYENLEQKVQERTNELNQALKDVKFTNAQIMDSIYYARRIQNTILIAQAQLKAAFADHFVLYLPKDVVSGDFYWMSQTPQYKMIAVVDCTGHGVPGAFMSIIGNGLLNEIINDKQVYDPAEVLQLLDSGVRKTLKQDENSNADGMDLCLCRIAYGENNNEVNVTFAGAKRPLFYGKQAQLEEIAGDRISISGWRGKKADKFNNHQVSLSKGDVLYLSTDGYADMPNPRRRNFTHRRLKELLTEILALPMAEQQERLLQTLQDYQQDARQRDDITLLGIRL